MKTLALMIAAALTASAAEPRPVQATPTLILDGIWGWHTRWEPLRARIAADVGPCDIWRYNNSGFVPIESLGAQLAARLRQIDGPFNLVGYSMGGLVVREALRVAPDLPVQRVAVLNSPHGGSLLSWLLAPLPACSDMRPGSPFLRRLNESAWPHPTLATWCPFDLMVFPGSSAKWDKASVVIRDRFPAHTGPLFSRTIRRAVVAFLLGSGGK